MCSKLLRGVAQEWDEYSQKEKNLKNCLVWFIKFNVNNSNGFLILLLVMVCGVVWHGFVQTPYTQPSLLFPQPAVAPSLNSFFVRVLINVKNISAFTDEVSAKSFLFLSMPLWWGQPLRQEWLEEMPILLPMLKNPLDTFIKHGWFLFGLLRGHCNCVATWTADCWFVNTTDQIETSHV